MDNQPFLLRSMCKYNTKRRIVQALGAKVS